MNMAESADDVKDTFRVNGVQVSRTFKINRCIRELNGLKTYTGEFTQTSPQEIRCSDVNWNERVPTEGSSDDKD
jgi:hypothetical protein